MRKPTMLSLFSGSGGFELAGVMCGIEPVACSEIEPYPIAVTKTRFPNIKHLGSVTDIKGNEIDPVDVITFGSPCQDLSVAGKRAGLKHTDNGDEETTRSGLFMEAVRIIKEMREATNGKYPRFALWENVPGAFSSNKGEDFRVVLEELIKIVEPSAVMPAVPKNGWPYSDSYCGDEWSLAYRVFDAQYWGVPQRRRRIYLVLDLGGQRAGEVSFEHQGLRGYFTEGRTPWQAVAGDAENRTGTADCEGNCVTLEPGIAAREGGHVYEGVSGTLRANAGDNQMAVAYGISPYHSNCMKSDNPHSGIYVADTARTLDAMNCGYPACNQGSIAIVEPVGFDDYNFEVTGNETCTLRAGASGGACGVSVIQPICFDGYNSTETGDKAATLGVNCGMSTGRNGVVQPTMCYDIGEARLRTPSEYQELSPTITARCGTGGNNVPAIVGVYKADDGSTSNASPTLVGDHNNRVTDHSALVLCCQPVVCMEGNGSRPSHRDDGYRESEMMYTLNATEQHSVAYSLETFHCVAEEEMAAPLKARDYKDPLCVCVDRAFFNQGQNALYTPQCYEDGTTPTLVAKGPSAVAYGVDCRNATEYEVSNGALQAACNHNHNSNNVVRIQYIVRRLTPTECARLQGFPDRWATPDKKTEFTDEEYKFWLNVRNTHAEINGKAVKDYTKDQMLTWYNKLHTDSSEYKLWGNGIALPTALYLMQGIADVFDRKDVKND